jgi:uncharacterized protein YecT (DUF1311 family)
MILLLLLATSSPCAVAERTSAIDRRRCHGELDAQTDREMSAQWKLTVAAVRREDEQNRREKLNQPDLAAGLLASQRAWLRYREAHCTMVSEQFAGGTGQGEVYNLCRIHLNRERTVDLKRRAAGYLYPPRS